MRRLLLLLLVAPCAAQIEANLPNCYQVVSSGSLAQTLPHLVSADNIAINDTIVVGMITAVGTEGAVTDSLGNTWTTTSGTTTPAPQTGTDVYMSYTQSSSAGADTITVNGSAAGVNVVVCKGLGAVDGSLATNTYGGNTGAGGGTGSFSTSNTTGTNNDVCVTAGGSSAFGSQFLSPSNNQYLGFAPLVNQSGVLEFLNAGAKGTITSTLNTYNDFSFGSHATFAAQTSCFKPSTILIADSQIPDIQNNVAYSAQLHCIGGTATQTYSLFSGALPTGITLNTATGVISGTSTASGSYTPAFKCTDGTVTSASQSLPVTVTVGGLQNPTIGATFIQPSGDVNGTFGSLTGVRCGSVIVVFARGDDTHGTNGWLQSGTGSNNFVSDTFGSPVRRYEGPVPGNISWPLEAYIIGPVTKSGTDTIILQNNQSASSSRGSGAIFEVKNGNVVDYGVGQSTLTNTSSGSFGASYTSVVPNTLLVVGSDTDQGVTTLSLAAPFSQIASSTDIEGTSNYSSALIAAAGSTTATANFTGGSTGAQRWDQLIIPVRAAIPPSSCTAFVGNYERQNRLIY